MWMAVIASLLCSSVHLGLRPDETRQIAPGDTEALLTALHVARDQLPPFRVTTKRTYQATAEVVDLEAQTGSPMTWRPLAPQDWPAPLARGTFEWQVDGHLFRLRELPPEDGLQVTRICAFNGQRFASLRIRENPPGIQGTFMESPVSVGHSNPLLFGFVNVNMSSIVWPATVDAQWNRVTSGDSFEYIRGHATLRLTVEAKHTGQPLRHFWLARDFDWTPIRVEHHDEEGNIISLCDALELVEISPHAWLPIVGEKRVYAVAADDPSTRIPVNKHVVTVEPGSLVVLESLPPDALEITMPPGTLVIDQIEDRTYVVGESQELLLEQELARATEEATADPAVRLHRDAQPTGPRVGEAHTREEKPGAGGQAGTVNGHMGGRANSLWTWGLGGVLGGAGFLAMFLVLQRLHSSTQDRVRGHCDA